MKGTEENDTESLVMASRIRLVNAYEAWLKNKGRAERLGEFTPEKHSDRLFVKAIRDVMDLGRRQSPRNLGIPTTRSGWSNWRSGRSSPFLKMHLDVVKAIKTVSGIDTTANQFLSEESINATDLVTIGEARIEKTQTLDQKCVIVVTAIDFRASDSKDVLLSDTKRNASPHDVSKVIGQVRYGLKQASIFVVDGGTLEISINRLHDGTTSAFGSSYGAELSIDDNDNLRWRVQPPYPKQALEARLEGLQLCEGWPIGGYAAIVGVSVLSSDIAPEISFDKYYEIPEQAFQVTKKRMVEKIIKNRYLDQGPRKRYILSQASLKT